MRQITLSRFLIEEQRDKNAIAPDLRSLNKIVSRAGKTISIAIGTGRPAGVQGMAGSDNAPGEARKRLDVIANEILQEANEWGGHLADKDGPRSRGRKLRRMHEGNPMAFIIEQAGGAATDGRQRRFDIVPLRLHQRVTVVPGSRHEVERLGRYHGR